MRDTASLSPSEKDILTVLQERGSEFLRPDISALAEALGYEKRIIQDGIERLDSSGVLEGYSALVDEEKLGFLTLFVEFACEYGLDEKITNIEKFGNEADFSVVAAYVITGDKDIHLEVKVRGIDGYKAFVRRFADEEKGISNVGTARGTLAYQKIGKRRSIDLG